MAGPHTWVGGTSGDFSVAANWDTIAVPADTETIYINGTVSITAGLDQSAKTFAAAVVLPGYTGTLGVSAASPLKFNATALTIYGSGTSYLYGTMASATIRTQSPDLQTWLSGAATSAKVQLRRGILTLGGATYTQLNVIPADGLDGNATLINQGATLTLLNSNGGSISQTTGTITEARATHGTLNINGGTITTARLFGDAKVDHRTSTNVTLFELHSERAAVDGSKDGRARTWSTVQAPTGASINANNGIGNITITTKIDSAGVAVVGWAAEEL